MPTFDIFTLLLILSALFSYLNHRTVRLPPTIAFMLGSLVLSLLLLFLESLGIGYATDVVTTLKQINFSDAVLYGILSFLLFAGSLQLNIRDMASEKWVILTLATVGVIISTFVVGTLMYGVFLLLGLKINYLYSLAFGALISPTDPVIVIGMLKGSKASNPLRMKIMGEALFNDGIAIVLFVTLMTMATVQMQIDPADVTFLLAQQLVGSSILGLAIGWVTHRLLSHVERSSVQVFTTLGIVAGSYDLALLLGVSGPITIVIVGLFVKNHRGHKPIPRQPFEECCHFWGLLDEFLNAALFVMMGLALLSMEFAWTNFFAGLFAIVVVLLGRFISVWIPIRIFRFFRPFTKGAVTFLTWVGLRGGIPLALALSLHNGPISRIIVPITYMVVVFSTLVQALTFKKFIHKEEY